ncbi:hypothetical protein BASA81_016824 [Batrachochytrium salamandrivorans]|nr:hypothetical protein BASA81_016824 [Batrachochytrium salamandrivorans]
MFSFVVAVSYAAALPQPAELSEKYSNNADATLASGLEARSYQPGLNSYKESATLTSLERRDDSKNDREFDDSEYDSEENVNGFMDSKIGGILKTIKTIMKTILRDRLEKIVDLTHFFYPHRTLTR